MIDALFPMLYHEGWQICIRHSGCPFICRIIVCGSSHPLYLFLTPRCFSNLCVLITWLLAQLNIASWIISGSILSCAHL
uniref:Uncharacterized protein n=1 Tax=Arundo donax TaxID=35708 RepID=A0A0A9BP64_ARUDO